MCRSPAAAPPANKRPPPAPWSRRNQNRGPLRHARPIRRSIRRRRAVPSTINTLDMLWNDLIAEIPAVGVFRQLDAAHHRHRIRLAPRPPGARLRRHERRHHRRQSLHRKALAAGALGIITDSAPTFDHLLVYQRRLSGARSRTWPSRAGPGLRRLLRSSRANAGRHRHHRHQRQNHHRLSHRSAAQRRGPQDCSRSAPSSTTSPEKRAPRCTPRLSRATSSS